MAINTNARIVDANGNTLVPAPGLFGGQPGGYVIAGTSIRATPVNAPGAATTGSGNANTAPRGGGPETIDFNNLQPGRALTAPGKITPELAAALLGVPVVNKPKKNTDQINFKTAAERLGYELVDAKGKVVGTPPAGVEKSPLVQSYYAGETELADSLGRAARAEQLAKSFLNTYATNYYTARGADVAPSVNYLRDQILRQGYGTAIQDIVTDRSTDARQQPFYSAMRSDPEFRPFVSALDMYGTYLPGYEPSVREVTGLAQNIQDTNVNRALQQFINQASTDPRYAEAYAGSPAANIRPNREYAPVEFTGIKGLRTDTPEYLAEREAARVNIGKGIFGEDLTLPSNTLAEGPGAQTYGQTGQVTGGLPFAYGQNSGIAAPGIYRAPVDTTSIRPNVNMSPADFAAADITSRLAEEQAARVPELYVTPANMTGIGTLTPEQIAAFQAAAAASSVPATQAGAVLPVGTAPAAAAAPVSMKEGGIASLADDAEAVRGAGRYGDDRLVHVNSEELGIMQGVFGKPTINPKTGLPEFFLGGLFKGIGKIFKKVLSVAAKVIPFVAPFIPGIGPLAQAGIAGLSGAFSGGKFDLKRGLLSGLLSFGAGQALSGLKAAGAAGSSAANAASSVANVADDALAAGVSSAVPASAAQALAPQAAAGSVLASQAPQAALGSAVAPQVANAASTPLVTNLGQSAVQALAPAVAPSIASAAAPSLVSQIGSNIVSGTKEAGAGLRNLINSQPGALDAFKEKFGTGSALALTTGLSGVQAIDEQQALEEEQRRLQDQEDEEQRKYIKFFRENTVPWQMAEGGEIDDERGYDMAKGGMAPRYLDGPGDGMSDSIKANIEGKREARLADGEFVIPADVVSHLGNGSSKAGAKRLYAMMDRVRKARTGTKRQGREINPMRMMPA